MNLVEGVQEEIKRVTAIIQEYSKYEGGQLAFEGFAFVGDYTHKSSIVVIKLNKSTNDK